MMSFSKMLHAGTDETVAVYCARYAAGKPTDPLKEFAVESGIPVHRPKRPRDAESLDLLKSLDADLMVLACVAAFLPEAARATPELGSICFHPSLLPPHRGPSAVNWRSLGGRGNQASLGSIPPMGLIRATFSCNGNAISALTTP